MEIHLQEIRRETPSVVSLIFDKPAGFTYKAGQFLRWEFPVDNCDERCNKRSFSISSSPTEDFLMLTVRTGPSRLKQTLAEMHPPLTARIVGPLGRFVIDKTMNNVVFLGGGVGITPMRSMIKDLTDRQIPLPITLLYSNKTPQEIIFRQELDTWQEMNQQFKVFSTISQPPNKSWQGNVGRIDKSFIENHVEDIKSAHFFSSGPPMMVSAMLELLRELGITDEQMHLERFTGY